MQEIEHRPVKKRRFFVEDSEPSNFQKRSSPDANISNETEVSDRTANLTTEVGDDNNKNNVKGHIHEAADDSNDQDILDPSAFRAVVGEDVSEDVIDTIREISGNSLTRGQFYGKFGLCDLLF